MHRGLKCSNIPLRRRHLSGQRCVVCSQSVDRCPLVCYRSVNCFELRVQFTQRIVYNGTNLLKEYTATKYCFLGGSLYPDTAQNITTTAQLTVLVNEVPVAISLGYIRDNLAIIIMPTTVYIMVKRILPSRFIRCLSLYHFTALKCLSQS